jgi:diaminopimelate dehydrogenase
MKQLRVAIIGWGRLGQGDPLFADEPTQVLEVPDLTAFQSEKTGVLLERMGNASSGSHASLILEARCDPTAFSARLMVDAAGLLWPHARGAWRYTPFGLVPLPQA